MLNIFTPDHGRLVNIQPEEIASRKPVWMFHHKGWLK
jgi:hypothetical protein